MTVVRDHLFPQKPPGSRFRFSRTGVQPSPGSSTIELPSDFAESTAAWRETWLGPTKHNSRKYIATKDILRINLSRKKSAVFTMCYANTHAAIVQSICTELVRGHGSQEVFEGL